MPLLSAETNYHAVSAANAYRFKQAGESDAAYVARLAAELDAKIVELGSGTVAAFFCEPSEYRTEQWCRGAGPSDKRVIWRANM